MSPVLAALALAAALVAFAAACGVIVGLALFPPPTARKELFKCDCDGHHVQTWGTPPNDPT